MKSALLILTALLMQRAECKAVAAETSTGDAASTWDSCLKKDSIQCMQLVAYRNIRAFFDRDSIPLVTGLSLVREAEVGSAVSSTSAARELGRQVEEAQDVSSREQALEQFALGEAAAFVRERSLRVDLPQLARATARAIADRLPTDVRTKISELITEGRGKKKALKVLLPILLVAGVKAAGAVALSVLGLALLAKKALLVSTLALLVSGALVVLKLVSQSSHPQHEVHEARPVPVAAVVGGPYSYGTVGGGGYPVGGGVAYESTGYSHGEFSAHPAPVAAHSLAYSAHKPVRR
ncbi:uncharacterized protein LOC124607228 [Schistocerca americana]|uniref:uncharacterized protein LOC124607228 n=1 Tax=Schistocerca americana TaxID=7009 RepID=UPI001F4F3CBF|nr:uncharacterized protein LOC124607228 [Schistocerca americana]